MVGAFFVLLFWRIFSPKLIDHRTFCESGAHFCEPLLSDFVFTGEGKEELSCGKMTRASFALTH